MNPLVDAYRAALAAGDRGWRKRLQTLAMERYGRKAEALANAFLLRVPVNHDTGRQVARVGVLVALERAAHDGGDLDQLVERYARAELVTWTRKTAA